MGNVQIQESVTPQLVIDTFTAPTSTPSNAWAANLPLCKRGVRFKSLAGSGNVIYLSTSSDGTSSAHTWPLADQEVSPLIEVMDPKKIFVLGSTSSLKVAYILQ